MKSNEAECEYSVVGESTAYPKGVLPDLMRAAFSKGASFRFRVGGASMLPFIREDDVITVAALAATQPSVGSVIAFVHPERKCLIVHRAVLQRGETFIMKGDNIPIADGCFSRECMLGSVVSVERRLRRACFGQGQGGRLVAFLSRMNVWSLLFRCWLILPLGLRNAIKERWAQRGLR